MKALGHTISHEAGCREDWTAAKHKMWRAFYRTCAGRTARGLSEKKKRRLLHRVVGPVLDYHNSRWAVTPNLLAEVDRVQRKMTAIILSLRKRPDEPPEGFVRRRGRTAGQLAATSGLWSLRTARRVVAWDDYLARPSNAHSWSAELLRLRGRQWLQERRMQNSSLSMQSGRTGTRLQSGTQQMRWHDGAVIAREDVQQMASAQAASSAAKGRAELDRIVQQQRYAMPRL